MGELIDWTLAMIAAFDTTFHVGIEFDRKLFHAPLAKFMKRFPHEATGL
jgi:hypothetical protein